jgi:hypothetical protein
MPLIGKRDQVRQLRLTNPHWSLGDIAQETGISRERVRQLLEAEGLPTRRVTPRAVFDSVLASMPAQEDNHPVASAHPDSPTADDEENAEDETLPSARRSLVEGSGSERDV